MQTKLSKNDNHFFTKFKYHGYANTVTKGVAKLTIEDLTTSFEVITNKDKLSKKGYLEQDATNTTIYKVKSYVSCAIGRINE